MRISIVIPNYNSGEVLERAVRSLLAQNYPDLQLIMADAGSRDASREIIERYRGAFDVVISGKDQGQADGLNKGFAHATGEIFGWLCADDELLPGALHHVAEIFRQEPSCEVLTGTCERIYPDGSPFASIPDPEAWQKIHILNVIEQASTFWRSSLHKRLGPLDTGYHLAFDWDLWCRMRLTGAHLITTDRVLSRYHFSASNKSGSAGDLFAREAFRIIRKYGPLDGRLAHIFRFLYRHFDLHGCYDQPPKASRARMFAWGATLHLLRLLIGAELLYCYNWHFASCQQRNLKWW